MSSPTHPVRNRPPAVGLFDSGVGGLSVFEAVRRRLPCATLSYCADNANFPYGTKTEAEVLRAVLEATDRFVRVARLDFLVIACNTASTIALKALREAHSVSVIGVVPAIKPAALLSRTGTIALLATKAAAQTVYADDLIKTFAAQSKVLRAGSSRLVELAEAKLRGHAPALEDVRDEIRPLFEASPPEAATRLDTIVLGCTHFPLLADELAEAAPWPVRWLDSGDAIATRVENLANEHGFSDDLMKRGSPAYGVAYFTKDDAATAALAEALAARGLTRTEILP